MRKYGESKTTRIMMATVPHATSGLGLRKFQADGFLLTRVYDLLVGIATRYGLDGPGIETRWGRDFSYPSRPALGPTQPPIQWVPGLSRG